MLRLTATDQSITMTTSATGSVDYISDWTDIVNATAVTTAGSGQGNVTTAATTTIIAAPASGSSRAVKSAMISNRHGSTSNTIQLFKTVGAASYAISKPLVLLAGETVRFSDEGFCFVGNACELEVTSATTAEQLKSNATTGVMQIVGPAAGTTRVVTVPDANATMARTDAAQTFSGVQTFGGRVLVDDTTDATTTTDGSLQTDGGLSVAKSAIIGAASKISSTVASQCTFSGYSKVAPTKESFRNGQITFGGDPTYCGEISYGGESSGYENLYYDNAYDATTRGHVFRVRTNGTPIVSLKLSDVSAQFGSDCRILIDNITDATTTNDGSLQTDGGLSVVKSAIIGQNLKVIGQSGFNNTAPIAKPTITGSKGGNAALASLLTALANYGLITDSTTA